MVEKEIVNQRVWDWPTLINKFISVRKFYTETIWKNNEIITEFNSFFNWYFTFNIGIPGSGKTSAMVYLINKMRREGKKVYYINLRVEDSQGNVVL